MFRDTALLRDTVFPKLDWTGLVKHELVKGGLAVKHELVRK